MTDDLPPPPISPEVALRGCPIPTDAFIDLAMKALGIGYAEAKALVLSVLNTKGIPHTATGEG